MFQASPSPITIINQSNPKFVKLLDEFYVEVCYEKDLHLIHVEWKGKCTSSQYKNVFITALDYAATHTVDYFISDIRKQSIISPSDRKWFEEYALPKAIELGLKQAGVVFSGDIFKKYYLNHISNHTKKYNLPFRFFTSVDEARTWFRKH